MKTPKPLILTHGEVSEFTHFVQSIMEDRQTRKQRLVPLKEAQEIADRFNAIKILVEEVRYAIKSAEPIGSLRSRLDSIERECNEQILAMHAHFHAGRKRNRNDARNL